MHVRSRVVLVMALSMAPVLMIGTQASAYVDVSKLKPPIRIPSSVLGSLDTATQAERIAAVSKVTTSAGVTGGGIATTGKAVAAVPALGTAITGFTVGYSLGTFALSKTPWAPDETFVPNTDATGGDPGHEATFTLNDRNSLGSSITVVASDTGVPFSSSYSLEFAGPSSSGDYAAGADYAMSAQGLCNDASPSGFFVDLSVLNAANHSVSLDLSSSGPAMVSACAGSGGGPSGIQIYQKPPLSGGSYVLKTTSPFADASPPDPDRQFKVVFQCRNAEGDLTDGDVVYSARFNETDVTWPAVPDALCEAGALDSLHVTEITPDLDWDPKVILDWEAQPEVKDWQDTYPECADGHCQLKLYRVPSGTTTRVDCFANPDVCTGWFESPTKLDDYQCVYGDTDVALSECNVYSRLFDNTPTPDYADPADGSSPAPSPGDPEASDCPPEFGLTVLTPWWWYKAATCALVWAFVPSDAVWSTEWASVTAAWGDNALGTLWGTTTEILTPFTQIGNDPDGNCLGFGVDLSALRMGVIHPFQACDPISQMISPVILGIETFSIFAGVILSSYRIVLKNFGGSTDIGAA